MTARRLTAVFAACFVLVLIATFPLAAALGVAGASTRGLSYARVTGSIWNGHIEGLVWRGNDLGAVQVSLRPLALLTGGLGLRLEFDGSGLVAGSGDVVATFGGVRLRDLSLSADLGTLPILLPLSGRVTLDLARVDMGTSGCRRAEGSIKTDALVNNPAGLSWRGPMLAGTVACEGDRLVIPLKGATDAENVAVAVTLVPDGTFGIKIDARTPNQAVVGALSAIGFVEDDGVMTLTQRGRWI